MKLAEVMAQTHGYPGRLWLVCFGAYALSQMDLALWSYALPVIRTEFGLSRTEIGLLTGGAFAIGGVLLVWLGVLVDRLGRRRMMIGSVVVSSILVSAHALAGSVLVLGALRAASMASGGLLYPTSGALVAEEAPARIRGLMTGMLQTAYPLGWFLASVFAVLLLLQDYGWRPLFLVALAGLPFVWVIIRVVRESARFVGEQTAVSGVHSRSSIAELFSAGLRRRTITLFAAQYFFVVAYGGAFIFAPLYFHEARGFDIAHSATLVGISNLIGVLGYFLAAWVGEFYLTRRTTTVIWTLLGSVFFIVFLWFTSGYAQSMIAFSVMAVFLLGAAAVKFAYIAEIFPTRLRATGITFCGSFAVLLGQATGPTLIGWLADTRGWNFAMFVGGAVPLMLAGFLYLLLKPIPSGLDVDEVQRRFEE